jgi:pimeloyl-ACP methyl ester carboxylesterase
MPNLKLDDIELYYETFGGNGASLVFIHGLGSSTRDWEFQVEEFSKDYQVVVFDVRGHGKSGKSPGPYSVPLFARDTAELIKRLGLAPAQVVGISMGGMIGLQLAISYPELVRSLVAVNCGSELLIKNINDRISVWKRQLVPTLFGMRKMGEVLSEMLFPKEYQEEIREIFIDRWAENDPRAYKNAFSALVGWSVTDQLGKIKCPVLVVSGDDDYTSVESKAEYVKKIQGAELVVIEDSRHPTPVDQPEAFNQVVREFLEKK